MTETIVIRGQALTQAPHVPVVIVGAGACGLTAAIGLRARGVDCVLLERDAQPSGSTALSSGFIPAAETRLQRALGIADSRETFAQDVQAKAHGDAAPHLVDAYTGAVAQAIDALEQQGIAFEVLDGFLYPGHRARRMHAVPERTGAALMASLERTALAAGADILTDAVVRVLYPGCRRPCPGCRIHASRRHAGATALRRVAAGLQRFWRQPGRWCANCCPRWARRRSAAMSATTAVRFAGRVRSTPGWPISGVTRVMAPGPRRKAALMSWAVMMQGGVQINAQGERFHDETQGYSEAAVHVLAPARRCGLERVRWPLLELARGFPDFVELEKTGAVKNATDVDALAALIGCDVPPCCATRWLPWRRASPMRWGAASSVCCSRLTTP